MMPNPFSHLQLILQEPDIRIDDVMLDSWKHDRLANAEALFAAPIYDSRNLSYNVLASRALVRARLHQWDAAIADATQVPSVSLLLRLWY